MDNNIFELKVTISIYKLYSSKNQLKHVLQLLYSIIPFRIDFESVPMSSQIKSWVSFLMSFHKMFKTNGNNIMVYIYISI